MYLFTYFFLIKLIKDLKIKLKTVMMNEKNENDKNIVFYILANM